MIEAAKSVGWAHREVRAGLRVAGEDAASFLQGQFSNDLRVEAEVAVYGLWLDLKGKVQGDAWVWREREGAWRVVSFGSEAAGMRERLERHIIADDVVIEDVTSALRAVVVRGFGLEESRTAAGGATRLMPGEPVGWRLASRWVPGAFEWVFPRAEEAAVAAWLREHGAQELAGSWREEMRLLAGVPWVPVDLGPGDLPQEGGLEVGAVSFQKGCYIGQEVMARLHAMGQVRRRLARLDGAGQPPAPGAQLWQGGRVVGTIRSAVRRESGEWLGLGMISLVHAQPDAIASAADAVADITWRLHERT